MKRSLLAASKLCVLAFVLFFVTTSPVLAQSKVKQTDTGKKKTARMVRKHMKHKKKVVEVTHQSDNDNKLKEIKEAKNKEKGLK